MTLVLDSRGVARAVLRDRALTAWLAAARAEDERVITCTAVTELQQRLREDEIDPLPPR